MKKIVYLFILMAFVVGACCGDSDKESTDATGSDNTEPTPEKSVGGESNNATMPAHGEEEIEGMTPKDGDNVNMEPTLKLEKCSEFLDNYETWANEYIDLLERFKKNPASQNIAKDYTRLTNELSTWTSDWFEFVECTKIEEYQQRYEKINKKIEQKQAELQSA